MAIIEQTVSLKTDTVERVQQELRDRELGGWLLYDFHGINQIASEMLGLAAMTRRYFVLLPAHGTPTALTHRIEQQPWQSWIGENRVYLGWRELEAQLAEVLRGHKRVAMEYEPGDAIPYVDRVPAGVVEMVRAAGAEVVSSAGLITAFYSRWSAAGEQSHRRAARAVQETAHAAFERIADHLRSGEGITEWAMREWIRAELDRRGCGVGADSIVAVNEHAANPHYGPTAAQHAAIRRGDLILIDLWGKQSDEAIFADQTWMGFAGESAPDRLREVWEAVRDARDAGVELLRSRWDAGAPVAGYEIDDAVRAVISDRGYEDAFIHRTGHSIDRELHGSGPNIDNLETRDTRRLVPGVGFSIEPGIYLSGDVGFRSEINVFIGPDGPEITTPDPQRDLFAILRT